MFGVLQLTNSSQDQRVWSHSCFRSCSFPTLTVVGGLLWFSCSESSCSCNLFLQIQLLFQRTLPLPLCRDGAESCGEQLLQEVKLSPLTPSALCTSHEILPCSACWDPRGAPPRCHYVARGKPSPFILTLTGSSGLESSF